MNRVGRWLDRGRVHASASTQSLDSLAESQNLESALRAVELIMDDDIEGAERGLADGNSAFHKLARGTLGFMRATMGFEQEVMKEASDQLYEAESTASTSHYKAQHDSRAFVSSIYQKGSEFALCQAEAQVMSAVVGVLNESLTESIRGFYKLRKAYITLDSLVQMEIAFMKAHGVKSLANSKQASVESFASTISTKATDIVVSSVVSGRSTGLPEEAHANRPSGLRHAEVVDAASDIGSDDSDEFYEADVITDENPVTGGYSGRLGVVGQPLSLDHKTNALGLSDNPESSHSPDIDGLQPTSTLGLLNLNADSEIFANSLDVFIHSGVNLMSGVLNLLISVIPPAFSKLLYIIGFRGDRERGIRMLWQASKFSNINGGMAGLVIFGWYNGLVGFCDIIPDSDPNTPDDIAGYPEERLQKLLVDMRERYPKSYLWLLEEARMAAGRRDLDTALEILSRPGKSKMRQLEALHMFEKSLNSLYAHKYEQSADCFLKCVELNGWSQSLYYYIAGAVHVEAYRQSKDPAEAEKHKKLADEYFKTAPSKVGKKKMMGRQLPFEGFVLRKLAKWEERASRWHCSFIDAIGVSPSEEMIYLWNGYKKMNQSQLEASLRNLSWSEQTTHWHEEDVDEHAILALLRGVILRQLRQHDESMEILKVKILGHEPHALKGLNRDDWPAPAAHYEMGVNFWMQRTEYIRQHGVSLIDKGYRPEDTPVPSGHDDVRLVQEAKHYVEKAKNWEKYELDARIGMKVTAALNAIKTWEQKNLTLR